MSDGKRGPYSAGWCSYQEPLQESPDIEIICGGLNAKTPTAAAIWRQGHLLHFGFNLSPAQMSENAKALLVNSVSYISGFEEDQALLRVPSPFAGKHPQPPSRLRSYLAVRKQVDWYLPSLVAEELTGVEKSVEALLEWHDSHAAYFQATDSGTWQVDIDAQRLGLQVNNEQVVAHALGYRDRGQDWKDAAIVLARSFPDGPGSEASAEAWQEWHEAHHEFLFFSEFGGYRWYVDSLAKDRGVPTSQLRGIKRGQMSKGSR